MSQNDSSGCIAHSLFIRVFVHVASFCQGRDGASKVVGGERPVAPVEQVVHAGIVTRLHVLVDEEKIGEVVVILVGRDWRERKGVSTEKESSEVSNRCDNSPLMLAVFFLIFAHNSRG